MAVPVSSYHTAHPVSVLVIHHVIRRYKKDLATSQTTRKIFNTRYRSTSKYYSTAQHRALMWSGVCCARRNTRAGVLRATSAPAPRRNPGRTPGGPPEAKKCDTCANICSKTRQESACKCLPNRRVSGCLGMSWRRNEVITLRLPKSGVARGQQRCTQVN